MQTTELRADAELTLRDAMAIAEEQGRLSIGESTRERLRKCRRRLDEWTEQKRRVYGLTTGFGPLATEYVEPERGEALQRNLVYHLSSGVGEPMSRRQTRAMMVSRASSLSKGYSAVRPSSLDLLVEWLNRGVTPEVPRMGSVGASGDLTPLAHMTLALMGEGRVRVDGLQMASDEAIDRLGLERLTMEAREGLAFVNGTSAMTGVALVNGVEAVRAVDVATTLSLLNAECLGGRREAWDRLLGEIRPHPGQRAIHDLLNRRAETSRRLDERRADERALGGGAAADGLHADRELPQDPYSIRCVPQLLGASLDAAWQHNRTVQRELNAVTDNPVVDPDGDRAVHGGNFFGQHVSLASDHLANAMLTIAVHAERCVARITDPARNGDLPPFMQPRQPGLQSGFMGAQVTATSLVAEMRTRAAPASVQSIPTNANNQDVVTMGTTAAHKASDHLDLLWRVLAIESLVLVQAMELIGGAEGEGFSEASRRFAREIRDWSDPLEDDRPFSGDIERVAERLRRRGTGLGLTEADGW